MSDPARPEYIPRDPNDSVLAQVIRAHLGELEEQIETQTQGKRLPKFVLRELRAITTCCDFTRGFIRLRCPDCRENRIIPFSCKSRICPTCAGRVMNERAAYLVDRVLNRDVRWRQYVVTFPSRVAIGLCFRSKLAAAVTRLCVRVLFEHQRARADAGAAGIPRPAAVVWIQRFSDGGGAWLHLHVLAPDGVFRELPDSLEVPFEPQPPPEHTEVTQLIRRIARRVKALIARSSDLGVDDPLLEQCATQAGKPVRNPKPPPSRARRPSPLQARCEDFSLHCATSVPAGRTDQLERMCRYLGRPPIPEARLSLLSDGRVSFRLKRPRRGAIEFVFEPVAFLARMAALVPLPGQNQVLYFGALSAGSPIRSAVLPAAADPTAERPVAPARPRRMSHSDLLRRVFSVDLLACPCGGRLQHVSVITDPDVVEAILAAIVLSNQAPARAPPQHSGR